MISADPNSKIPIFHVVLVVSSILLIICAILTALTIYLRVLQLSRRRSRRRKSTGAEEALSVAGGTNSATREKSPSPVVLKSARITRQPDRRQQLEIKI